MFELLESPAVSLVLGIAASFTAWYLVQRIRPRYRWATDISEAIGEKSRLPIHRINLVRKPRRFGRGRTAIDVTIAARVSVFGLGPEPKGEKVVNIPVLGRWRPRLGPAVTTTLVPQECDIRSLRYFPSELREKRSAGTLRMTDLLTAGDRAILRMYAFGYDAFSGSRWMLRSEPYTSDSIKRGAYDLDGHLNVAPDADGTLTVLPEIDGHAMADASHSVDHRDCKTARTSDLQQPLRRLRLVKGWCLAKYY